MQFTNTVKKTFQVTNKFAFNYVIFVIISCAIFDKIGYMPHNFNGYFVIIFAVFTSSVHVAQDLESLHLILSLYFFFKNAEKFTSGGLIL